VEYIVSIPHPKSEAAHSVTAQESDPEFNLDDFARSYTDSPEVLHEIFNLYVEEAPQRIKAVEAGLSSGDFDAVAKAAHSLANTSGTLQSTVTAEAARELESAARMKDEQQSEIAAKRLIALVRNILGRVEEYIADE
ncbi:MAG: Hpt domain-containing protein, partial [Spirochaetales bacterium]